MRRTVLALALLGVACGSKSGLGVDPAPLGLPDGEVPECTADVDCEDGVGCTEDRCEAGRCHQQILADACETGLTCEIGRCDSMSGCVTSPLACDDGVDCTTNSCVEPTGCAFEPDDLACPISHRCDPVRGCVAQALIHDNDALYQVDLPAGDFTRLTRLAARFTDIALASDRRLYGVNFDSVFEVDDILGGVRPLFPSPGELVALEEGPGGRLFGAGQDDRIVAMDPMSGAWEQVARLPAGWVASGDIAFVDGRMLVTVTDEASSETRDNQLAEVDLEGGGARLLGYTGFPCIWGVAAFGDLLYGFTCHGALIRIDPFTGEGEHLRDLGLRIGGAAAR